MIIRLKANGFKNLVDVDVRFGPFTCIAGVNGVGKSNLFDAIRFLSALASQPLTEARIVKGDAPALESQIGDGATTGVLHVEHVAVTGLLDPRQSVAVGRNEPINVCSFRRQVQGHHHGAEGPYVLDPGGLTQQAPQIVIGQHEHRVLRCVAGNYDGVGAWLVGLVGNAVEARQVEHVEHRGRHQAVDVARLHGVQ